MATGETITQISGEFLIDVPVRKSPEESVELRPNYGVSIDEEVRRTLDFHTARRRDWKAALEGSNVISKKGKDAVRRLYIVDTQDWEK